MTAVTAQRCCRGIRSASLYKQAIVQLHVTQLWLKELPVDLQWIEEHHTHRVVRGMLNMPALSVCCVTGQCERVASRTATKQELLRVHTHEHLQRLQLFCSGTVPAVSIPSDTYINQHTLRCAALAAGSAAELACRVVNSEASCGAAIIRPPGHHAESNTAMGFCFFNNAAVAARAAQAAGAERVLILDWDVHHGNGTQHIFEADPSVLYMSLHRYDRCVTRAMQIATARALHSTGDRHQQLQPCLS